MNYTFAPSAPAPLLRRHLHLGGSNTKGEQITVTSRYLERNARPWLPVMGEYHNNLTLEEAIKIYESIPAERMHGGKGIGFDLQDGDEDYSGEYELMSWDRVDRELIDMIPHYKESPLVQKAINDMEKYLADKKNKQAEITEELSEKQSGKNIDVEKNAEKKVTREPGSIKKSVLQSLKDYQARVKAQEKAQEKNNEHKKGDMEL